jgi:hypothetical protein
MGWNQAAAFAACVHTACMPAFAFACSAAHLDVWVGVCASIVSNEHAVTLAVVARTLGARLHLQQQSSASAHVSSSREPG